MAWELRGDKYYLYRKRRTGTGVRSEYVGCDLRAELLSARADAEKQRLAEERAALREEIRRDRELDGPLDDSWSAIERLVAVWLAANGFHKHRGEVRKRSFGRRQTP